jgi:hypothetical protein
MLSYPDDVGAGCLDCLRQGGRHADAVVADREQRARAELLQVGVGRVYEEDRVLGQGRCVHRRVGLDLHDVAAQGGAPKTLRRLEGDKATLGQQGNTVAFLGL